MHIKNKSSSSNHQQNTSSFIYQNITNNRPNLLRPKVLKNDSKSSFRVLEDTVNTYMNKTDESHVPAAKSVPRSKLPGRLNTLNYATDTQQSDVNEETPKLAEIKQNKLTGGKRVFRKKNRQSVNMKPGLAHPGEKLLTFGQESSTPRSRSNEKGSKKSFKTKKIYETQKNIYETQKNRYKKQEKTLFFYSQIPSRSRAISN